MVTPTIFSDLLYNPHFTISNRFFLFIVVYSLVCRHPVVSKSGQQLAQSCSTLASPLLSVWLSVPAFCPCLSWLSHTYRPSQRHSLSLFIGHKTYSAILKDYTKRHTLILPKTLCKSNGVTKRYTLSISCTTNMSSYFY